MVVMPRRWPWLALLVAFGWVLRVNRHADSALTFGSDLPAWVLNWLEALLQVDITTYNCSDHAGCCFGGCYCSSAECCVVCFVTLVSYLLNICLTHV